MSHCHLQKAVLSWTELLFLYRQFKERQTFLSLKIPEVLNGMLLCTKESLPDVKEETEHKIDQIILLQKWITSCCKERKHLWMRKKMYIYETHSSAQGLVCTNHKVFIVYKSDLITLSFAPDLPFFNFQTWRIMPKCFHRVRWLQLDSDSSSAILGQSPHLHSNCRALEVLREESRFFFFPCHCLYQ